MKTITAIFATVLLLCSFGLAQAQTKDEKKNSQPGRRQCDPKTGTRFYSRGRGHARG